MRRGYLNRINVLGLPGGKISAADGQTRSLLGWVLASTLLLSAPAFGDGTDRAGSIVASNCATCHGIDGNSVVPTIPKLAGRHPEYIVRELKDFISGRRKSDIMAPIVAALDPDDFELLGAYFGRQKPSSDPMRDEKAARAGRKLYLEGNEQSGVPACEGCHGTDAQGAKRFPRLAGQHREYLIAQLYNFRTKTRSTTRVMREVSARMTDAEIEAVAAYLASR